MHDLRLWTKVLLSGTLLAVLKGFLAWATVWPDPAGWDGCQRRLGKDGLMYFRELATGSSADGDHINLFQVIEDILLLEFHDLFFLHKEVCADTMFSSTTSFFVLFCVGLYDAMRTCAIEASRRAMMLRLASSGLSLIVLVHLILTVFSLHHYSADIVIALPLTLLVYSNPAIAVTTERLVELFTERTPALSEAAAEASNVASGSQKPQDSGQEQFHQDSGDFVPGSLVDVGHITAPCCDDCYMGGLFYLREQPGTPMRPPWTEESAQQHKRQLAEFAQIRERDKQRLKNAEHSLEQEHVRARRREVEAAAAEKKQLADEQNRLKAEEERILTEATLKLEAEKRAATELENKVAAEHQRFSIVESEFCQTRIRLIGEAEKYRKEATEDLDACAKHNDTIRKCELEREALIETLAKLLSMQETNFSKAELADAEEPPMHAIDEEIQEDTVLANAEKL